MPAANQRLLPWKDAGCSAGAARQTGAPSSPPLPTPAAPSATADPRPALGSSQNQALLHSQRLSRQEVLQDEHSSKRKKKNKTTKYYDIKSPGLSFSSSSDVLTGVTAVL